MNFYKRMIIKILENSASACDSTVLRLLKEGHDLTAKDKEELEDLIDNL